MEKIRIRRILFMLHAVFNFSFGALVIECDTENSNDCYNILQDGIEELCLRKPVVCVNLKITVEELQKLKSQNFAITKTLNETISDFKDLKRYADEVNANLTSRLNVMEEKCHAAMLDFEDLKRYGDEINANLASRINTMEEKLYAVMPAIATKAPIFETTSRDVDNVNPLGSTSSYTPTTTPTASLVEVTETDYSTLDLDVVFLLDGSGSISSTDFVAMKEFIKNVSLGIGFEEDHVHVGVVQYSNYEKDREDQPYLQTHIRIGEFSSVESFNAAVNGIIQHGYTTHTGQALIKVQDDFRNSINFGKSSTIRILILVTDGKATDGQTVPQAAEQLRSLGVIPYAVGIGNFNSYELRSITTGNLSSSERVFEAGDVDQLGVIAVQIEAEIKSLIASGDADDANSIGSTPSYMPATTSYASSTDVTEKDSSTLDLDVVFLLDGSRSIKPLEFDAIKDFVKTVSLRIGLGEDYVHVGVVQYSYYYKDRENQPYLETHIRIGEFSSVESFNAAVDGIIQHGYTTYTGQALIKVQNDFRSSINFGKSSTIRILILVTDGKATDGQIVPQAAEQLRSLGVIPYAVGIGGFRRDELRSITTGNLSSNERVFEAGDVNQLGVVAVKIEAEIKSIIASRGIKTDLLVAN